MGTALTDRQLKELGRLTRRLFLCFDSDAAGEEATLRGMELAVAQGFDVRVVSLPKGQDPADAPQGFEERLDDAESYLLHRVRLELDRALRPAGGVRPCAGGAGARRGLARASRRAAARWPTGSSCRARPSAASRRSRGDRDRAGHSDAAAGRRVHGSSATRSRRASPIRRCASSSASSPPEHFDSELHRRFRAALLDGALETRRSRRAACRARRPGAAGRA